VNLINDNAVNVNWRVLNNLVFYLNFPQGLRKGDVVALYMESRPEYVAAWLGLAKIGVVTALINFNLRLETFAHCVTVSGAKSVIFGAELIDGVFDLIYTHIT